MHVAVQKKKKNCPNSACSVIALIGQDDYLSFGFATLN